MINNISTAEWNNYIEKLAKINATAAAKLNEYIQQNGIDDTEKLIAYAYALVTKYGEATATLACIIYDEIALAELMDIAAAVPADTATYGETAKAINGALKQSATGALLSQVVSRLVKQAGADTTLQNAKRDGAYFAWIPSGDTCPYCLMISAIGWQRAGKNTIKGNHADHIHANCDCQFCVDFRGNLSVANYDYMELRKQIESETGEQFDYAFLADNARKDTKGGREGLNKMRRLRYKENAEAIREQKREAYAKRVEKEEVL